MYLHEQKTQLEKKSYRLPASNLDYLLIANSYSRQRNRIEHLNYKELQALRGNYTILLIKFVLATVTQAANHLFYTAARCYNTNPKITFH